jgi:uncharacterized membrane protein
MIRNSFAKLTRSSKDKISWRSHEPKRIEAFSDGAFAFGISLIIFSLEVPRSSHDLLRSMKGILPFAVCFAMIFRLWYEQYRFFRRYGMNDVLTIVLNGLLIFLVLVYIYPLKFTFSIAFRCDGYTFSNDDLIPVMRLYIGGITGVCMLFSGMYFNAYLKRTELNLTPQESYETKTHLYKYLFPSVAGILSIILICILKMEYFLFALSPLYASALFAFLVSRIRKKGFHKRFGNAPMIEPHLGAE